MDGSSTANFCIPAAQMVRQFAECRSRAESQPVFISSHGRVTHALLGIERFTELQAAARRPAVSDEQAIAGAIVSEFGAWLDLGLILCDAALTVESVNPAAAAMAGMADGHCAGRAMAEVFPALHGSVLYNHIERAAASRAPAMAECPSPFQPDRWLRLRAFWWKERVVTLLADITQEVSRERFADENASIMEAFGALSGTAQARLSPRGTIQRAPDALARLLGLQPDRLVGVAFPDLVDLAVRPQFRAALEDVLRGGPAASLATRLISNAGTIFAADAALAPLVGSYGPEGAIIAIRADT